MKKVLLISLCLFSTQVFAQNYQTALAGKRLFHKNADCAGWQFSKNGKTAVRRDEIICQLHDEQSGTWAVTWINQNSFFLKETVRPNDISPPRIFIYQITSMNGNKITLKEFSTSWIDKDHLDNDAPTIETFTIK